MAQLPLDYVPQPILQDAIAGGSQGGSALRALSLSPVAVEVYPQAESEEFGQSFVPPADPPGRGLSPSFAAPYGGPSFGVPVEQSFTGAPPLHHGLVESPTLMVTHPFAGVPDPLPSPPQPAAPSADDVAAALLSRFENVLMLLATDVSLLAAKMEALKAGPEQLVSSEEPRKVAARELVREDCEPAVAASQLLDHHAILMNEFATFKINTGFTPSEYLLKMPTPIASVKVDTGKGVDAAAVAQERSSENREIAKVKAKVDKPKSTPKSSGGEMKTSPYPDEFSDEEWSAMTVQKRGSVTRRKQKEASTDEATA
jgi:hypothetical protein